MTYVEEELDRNNNKLSSNFIERIANHERNIVTHVQVTPNTRVCVITLFSGHELVGYAQVLDKKNDVALLGQEVAYNNAINGLWQLCGNLAKVHV